MLARDAGSRLSSVYLRYGWVREGAIGVSSLLRSQMLTLLAAVASLAAWVVFAFILKVGAGAINLLLAVGGVLLVRWWALRAPATEGK